MGYTIELEIFESGGCKCHKAGDKLKYPEKSKSTIPTGFEKTFVDFF